MAPLTELHRPPLAALLTALGLLAAVASAQARELAAERAAFVEVEVAGVGISTAGAPAVLLRPPEDGPHAGEVIPIFISPGQARSIILALRETDPPRPMTHDLLRDTLGALQVELLRVYVDDVRNNTFYGMLELAVAGREDPVRVDSRPSDALALALRAGASVHVSPRVLKAARQLEHGGLSEEVVKAAGITVNAASDRLRQALELPDTPGVVVSAVTGPAAQAGLEPGALITQVNGEAAGNPERFRELLDAAGEQATITYWHQGASHRITIPADQPPVRQPVRGA